MAKEISGDDCRCRFVRRQQVVPDGLQCSKIVNHCLTFAFTLSNRSGARSTKFLADLSIVVAVRWASDLAVVAHATVLQYDGTAAAALSRVYLRFDIWPRKIIR